jgi:hypothetical protein
MPFKSSAQRRLFYAALKDPKLRKRHDITEETVKQLTEKDTGNRLPERVVRKAAKASKKTKTTTGD